MMKRVTREIRFFGAVAFVGLLLGMAPRAQADMILPTLGYVGFQYSISLNSLPAPDGGGVWISSISGTQLSPASAITGARIDGNADVVKLADASPADPGAYSVVYFMLYGPAGGSLTANTVLPINWDYTLSITNSDPSSSITPAITQYSTDYGMYFGAGDIVWLTGAADPVTVSGGSSVHVTGSGSLDVPAGENFGGEVFGQVYVNWNAPVGSILHISGAPQTAFVFQSVNYPVSGVPEPATGLLALPALAALAWWRRRR